jgi:hypothetical protein
VPAKEPLQANHSSSLSQQLRNILRLISHDQLTETAAGLLIGWTISRIFSLRRTRIEEKAAHLEYHDYETSPERKQLLLRRYPDAIVPSPSHNYLEQAKEEIKSDGLGWKYWLFFVGAWALGIGISHLMGCN